MQQANLIVNGDFAKTGGLALTLSPDFARKDEARWQNSTLPEIGRVYAVYTKRPPVKGTELVKHSVRLTRPTLITDSTTGVQSIDYVSVAELSIWVHPRATAAEREAAAAAFIADDASLVTMITDVVKNANSIT